MAQRNTAHNAAQDSGSEAGMTRERGEGEDGRDVACSVSNGGKTAAAAAGTAQTARLRRHPVLRHGTLGGAGEDGHQRDGNVIPRTMPPRIPARRPE